MNKPNHDPTPAEIAAECALIRKDWSEAEHRRRAGMSCEGGYTIPGAEKYGTAGSVGNLADGF